MGPTRNTDIDVSFVKLNSFVLFINSFYNKKIKASSVIVFMLV